MIQFVRKHISIMNGGVIILGLAIRFKLVTISDRAKQVKVGGKAKRNRKPRNSKVLNKN